MGYITMSWIPAEVTGTLERFYLKSIYFAKHQVRKHVACEQKFRAHDCKYEHYF